MANPISFGDPVNNSSLFEILENENFEKLKEMQMTNEVKTNQKYFIDQLRKAFTKKGDMYETSGNYQQVLSQCEDKLNDLIVSMSDFSIGKTFSFGGQSVVFKGTFKFVEVAVKRIGIESLNPKQMVILSDCDSQRNPYFGATSASEYHNAFGDCHRRGLQPVHHHGAIPPE
jgi:hypothetical protein